MKQIDRITGEVYKIANGKQRKVIDAVRSEGSVERASLKLNLTQAFIRQYMRNVLATASSRGIHTHAEHKRSID